jgi:hypothetical protein
LDLQGRDLVPLVEKAPEQGLGLSSHQFPSEAVFEGRVGAMVEHKAKEMTVDPTGAHVEEVYGVCGRPMENKEFCDLEAAAATSFAQRSLFLFRFKLSSFQKDLDETVKSHLGG